LVRIDPATGRIVAHAPIGGGAGPVIAAGTLWTAAPGSGGKGSQTNNPSAPSDGCPGHLADTPLEPTLCSETTPNVQVRGYSLTTLAPVTSITVPFPIPGRNAQTALTAGPDGRVIVAAGDSVAVVDPATRHVVRRIQVAGGQLPVLAVRPDGKRLYAGVNVSGVFRLQTYELANGALLTTSSMNDGGNVSTIVATAGGVWGITGSGMSDWVFFAPAADLAHAVTVGGGGGGGLAASIAISDGVAWIGGTHRISCAEPSTGHVRASAVIPPDHSDTAVGHDGG